MAGEEIVLWPCQVVSVGVCVPYVKVASKGVKSRKKNRWLDWVNFIYIVAFTYVWRFFMLAHLPENNINMVDWRLDSKVAFFNEEEMLEFPWNAVVKKSSKA